MRKLVIRGLAAGVTMLAGAAATPATAQTVGDQVTCTTTAYSCSPASATVGSGVEFLYGPTATPFLNLDFASNLLTVTGRNASAQFGTGVSVSFRDTTNAFTSAALASNTNSTLTASDVTFSNGTVKINFGGRTVTSTGSLTIALTTLAPAAVPEPATWALMLLGMAAVGGAMRQGRRGSRLGSLA